MKRFALLSLLGCLVVAQITACAAPPTLIPVPTISPASPTPEPVVVDPVTGLHWFGSLAFLYNGSQKIYFDPYKLSGSLPVADLILVTHSADAHFSVPDLKKIIGPNTQLVISSTATGVYEAARDELGIPATVLGAGETVELNGVVIEAVPAIAVHHRIKSDGGAGYLVTVDGVRLYAAGGSASYPEMAGYECDLAMLAVNDVDDLNVMMDLIPAKAFVLDNASIYTIKALAKLSEEDPASGHKIALLEPIPFERR